MTGNEMNKVEINTAGTTFHREAFDKVLEGHNPLKNFDIKLERESDNEYDANAIMVIVDGEHIGYIPAKLAIVLAPLMDNGQSFDPEVTELGLFEKTQKNGTQKVLPYCRFNLYL